MQINDVVVCAFSGQYLHIQTGQEYIVKDVTQDHGITYLSVVDGTGTPRHYDAKRFMLNSDVGVMHVND